MPPTTISHLALPQILWHQFLKFKEMELPAKEADKSRSKVIFQSLEVSPNCPLASLAGPEALGLRHASLLEERVGWPSWARRQQLPSASGSTRLLCKAGN